MTPSGPASSPSSPSANLRSGADATANRWQVIKDAFDLALDLPAPQLPTFLSGLGLDFREAEQVTTMVLDFDRANGFFSTLIGEMQFFLAHPATVEPGELLCGRFLLVRALGSGGMGEVYEAEDQELRTRVALKIMNCSVASHPGSLRRFRDEIRLARTINDVHVCRVYDVARHTDATRDFIFFTMELLEGETLADRIARQGPIAPQHAMLLASQMIAGLAAAHRCGIVHRDFKSSNVFICSHPEPRVVITDFGLSRQLVDQTFDPEELDGITALYAAPEQLLRGNSTVASDIYSLGVVMHEMLTAQLPARVNTADANRPARARISRTGIPPVWESVILRCLHPDAAKRFADVKQVGRALGCLPGARTSRRRFLLLVPALSLPAYLAWKAYSPAAPVHAGPTLAILPFAVDPSLQFVADGIADRLGDSLGQLPGIQIISRTAAARGPQPSLPARAASQLQATHVLTGAVRGASDQLRLHLELFRTGQPSPLWSATYEFHNDEAPAVTEPAVRALIRVLRLDVTPALTASSTAIDTSNPEAWRLYLLGKFQTAKRDAASLRDGIALLARSVQADPDFALAHAALGSAWTQLAFADRSTSASSATRARAAAERAIAIRSDCAQAYVTLAILKQIFEWDWSGSEANYRRAIAINPNLADARHWLARLIYPQKRFDEALQQLEQARTLDPLDVSLRVGRGMVLTYARRSREAVRELRLVIAEQPTYFTAWIPLSCALESSGDLAAALQAAQRGAAANQRASFALAQLARMYAVTGNYAQARAILDDLISQYAKRTAFAGEIAYVYAGWKDAENTLEWLERGLPNHDLMESMLPVDFAYDFLRRDPRFRAIQARVYPTIR